jgi:hypothetical protein
MRAARRGCVGAPWAALTLRGGNHTQRLKRLKRVERRRNVMCVQNARNAYIKGANNDAQRTARQARQMARRAWKQRRRGLYIVQYRE